MSVKKLVSTIKFYFFIFPYVLLGGVALADSNINPQIFIQQTNGPSSGAIKFGLAFSPKNPDIIYVDTYKSTNGGETWTEFESPDYRGVNTLTVDPNDPNIVYIGTVNLLFKSIDGAKTWKALGALGAHPNTPEWDGEGMTNITVSPHNGDIIYAGKSNGDLFKSTNGGQNWIDISHKINTDAPISRIAFNIEKVNEIFVSTGSWYLGSLTKQKREGNGLFKSFDGGNTFEHLKNEFSSYEVQDVDVSDNLVFVTTLHGLDDGEEKAALYKSIDSGKTWKKLLESWRLTHVAINPRNKNHIIVSSGTGGGTETPSFFLSYDGGTTWKEIKKEATEPFAYTHELEVVGDGRVYAQDYYRPFMKSTDGGKTWKWSSSGIRNSGIQILEVNPKNRNDIFAGTIDGALHRSYDGGKTWKRSYIYPFDEVYISTIDFHPENPDIFYFGVSGGGASDGRHGGTPSHFTGFYRTIDGGKNWKKSTGLITVASRGKQLEVYDIFVYPKNPNLMLVGTSGDGIWRSEDGGKTWKESSNGIPKEGFYWQPLFEHPEENGEERECREEALKDPTFNFNCFHYATRTSMSIFLNPHRDNEIWYTTLNGIFISHDLGKTWKWLSDDLKNIHTHFMAFDPFDPNTIYVGTHQGAVGPDGKVMKSSRGIVISRDGGKTWLQVDNKLDEHGATTAPGEGHDIRAIAIDPKNANFVAVGTNHGFYVSKDKGKTWKEIKFLGYGEGVEDIRIDASAKLLYLSTLYHGVWRGILNYDVTEPANIQITGVSFPSSVVVNTPFPVIISVDNLGGKAGSIPVSIKIDNWQSSQTPSLSGADQSVVTFSSVLKKKGVYDVLINNTNYGKIVITQAVRVENKNGDILSMLVQAIEAVGKWIIEFLR